MQLTATGAGAGSPRAEAVLPPHSPAPACRQVQGFAHASQSRATFLQTPKGTEHLIYKHSVRSSLSRSVKPWTIIGSPRQTWDGDAPAAGPLPGQNALMRLRRCLPAIAELLRFAGLPSMLEADSEAVQWSLTAWPHWRGQAGKALNAGWQQELIAEVWEA